tara:strand:+ start:18639 stop:18779 length:141 start_codon:yes stop_codon:yes gene_type:complete
MIQPPARKTKRINQGRIHPHQAFFKINSVLLGNPVQHIGIAQGGLG